MLLPQFGSAPQSLGRLYGRGGVHGTGQCLELSRVPHSQACSQHTSQLAEAASPWEHSNALHPTDLCLSGEANVQSQT